ncbi:MAG: hypothetical protein QM676_11095 [Novosphingobium sp.]
MDQTAFSPIALLTSCLILGACAPRTPEEFAAKIADRMTAKGPEQLSGGATLGPAKAKGDTLIVEMDRMPNRHASIPYEDRIRSMQRVACNEFTDFLGAGGTVRMEGRMNSGHRLPPVIVKHCDPNRAPDAAPGKA